MKIANVSFVLSLILLTACSSTKAPMDPQKVPETVMVTYHVKPGMNVVLQKVLSQAWAAYRKENLVFAQPHIIVQDPEDRDQTRVVEIFTWVSHSAPGHASDSVKQLWAQMQSLCLGHNGHNGLEGGEVSLVVPKTK
jgi:hypothetical protein